VAKLVIIDGHSLLYRAFFAVPPLSTKDGTPTNALYGFLRMLLKLWREERPDYLVVTFDAPTPIAPPLLPLTATDGASP